MAPPETSRKPIRISLCKIPAPYSNGMTSHWKPLTRGLINRCAAKSVMYSLSSVHLSSRPSRRVMARSRNRRLRQDRILRATYKCARCLRKRCEIANSQAWRKCLRQGRWRNQFLFSFQLLIFRSRIPDRRGPPSIAPESIASRRATHGFQARARLS